MPLSSPLHTQRSVWHIDAETRRRRTYHFIELQLGKPLFLKVAWSVQIGLVCLRGRGRKRMHIFGPKTLIFGDLLLKGEVDPLFLLSSLAK